MATDPRVVRQGQTLRTRTRVCVSTRGRRPLDRGRPLRRRMTLPRRTVRPAPGPILSRDLRSIPFPQAYKT